MSRCFEFISTYQSLISLHDIRSLQSLICVYYSWELTWFYLWRFMQVLLLRNSIVSEYLAVIQRQSFVHSIHLFVVHKLAVVVWLMQLGTFVLVCRMSYPLLILRILHRVMIILKSSCWLLLWGKYLMLQSLELLVCLLAVHVWHIVSELLLN